MGLISFVSAVEINWILICSFNLVFPWENWKTNHRKQTWVDWKSCGKNPQQRCNNLITILLVCWMKISKKVAENNRNSVVWKWKRFSQKVRERKGEVFRGDFWLLVHECTMGWPWSRNPGQIQDRTHLKPHSNVHFYQPTIAPLFVLRLKNMITSFSIVAVLSAAIVVQAGLLSLFSPLFQFLLFLVVLFLEAELFLLFIFVSASC